MRVTRHLASKLALAIAIALPITVSAQPTPLPSADTVMSQVKTQAAAEHKAILLVFSASWCGPCHLFEGFLTDPQIKPILDKAFVIGRLDVGESPTDKRHADSPGGEALKTSLGGHNAGFPYIIATDASGTPIVSSLRPTGKGKTENIGYPDLPVEIDWFMTMLQKSAPTLTSQETTTLRTWLKQHSHSS